MKELFPEEQNDVVSREQVLIRIPGSAVHLIERDSRAVQLACGELAVVSLVQDETNVAVFAKIGDQIQWPLTKDESVVKLDGSHYFFTLRVPFDSETQNREKQQTPELLNYGLTIAGKGQESVLNQLDQILEEHCCLSVKKVEGIENLEIADARRTSPEEISGPEDKREEFLSSAAAYWTVLAPNVEEYGSRLARMIAGGSGHVVKGILWCGDLTVDRLRWANEYLSKRIGTGPGSEINPAVMKRIERFGFWVKKLSEMSEKVAIGILSGVVRVSGFFTGSIVNSRVAKKFFSLMPGEIVLASLDGFNKVCDAVEVSGRNVMSTTSIVTTVLLSKRYGEEAGKITKEGLDAAGHAIGAAWAVFKIRKAIDPTSAIKPSTLAAAAAARSDSSRLKST